MIEIYHILTFYKMDEREGGGDLGRIHFTEALTYKYILKFSLFKDILYYNVFVETKIHNFAKY